MLPPCIQAAKNSSCFYREGPFNLRKIICGQNFFQTFSLPSNFFCQAGVFGCTARRLIIAFRGVLHLYEEKYSVPQKDLITKFCHLGAFICNTCSKNAKSTLSDRLKTGGVCHRWLVFSCHCINDSNENCSCIYSGKSIRVSFFMNL